VVKFGLWLRQFFGGACEWLWTNMGNLCLEDGGNGFFRNVASHLHAMP